MSARIVFHLPARYLEDWRDRPAAALYRKIAELTQPRGAQILVVDRRDRPFQGGATTAYDDGDLHIIDGGRAQGPGVLNGSLAYLPPFWHLDPLGVQAESGIGAMTYDPNKVMHRPAMAFFDRMRARYPLARKSRRGQNMVHTSIPEGGIAVFLQGDRPQEQGLSFCSAEQMLRAVAAGAGGRQVWVKPHPLALLADAELIDDLVGQGVNILPTTANVVDLIAAASVTVSFNSACALEGFLQRKPAILFGRSDFHHFSHVVRRPEDFPQTLDAALCAQPGGYAKYLYWYFSRNCLNITAQDLASRLYQIFDAKGFPDHRLGLEPA